MDVVILHKVCRNVGHWPDVNGDIISFLLVFNWGKFQSRSFVSTNEICVSLHRNLVQAQYFDDLLLFGG